MTKNRRKFSFRERGDAVGAEEGGNVGQGPKDLPKQRNLERKR